MRKAVWPFCAQRKLLEEEKYDLYGPIWIMITLIVEITIIGFISYQIDVINMVYEIKHGKPATSYMSLYSLDRVAKAAFVMIGYFVLNPLMLYLLCKYVIWISYIRYLYLFSIYGYSFTIFVISTALTVIPVTWMNWAVLCYSAFNSMLCIFLETKDLIMTRLNEGAAKFALILLWLLASHAVFIMSLQLYFFST